MYLSIHCLFLCSYTSMSTCHVLLSHTCCQSTLNTFSMHLHNISSFVRVGYSLCPCHGSRQSLRLVHHDQSKRECWRAHAKGFFLLFLYYLHTQLILVMLRLSTKRRLHPLRIQTNKCFTCVLWTLSLVRCTVPKPTMNSAFLVSSKVSSRIKRRFFDCLYVLYVSVLPWM